MEGNVFTGVCPWGVSPHGQRHLLDREPLDRDPPGQRPPLDRNIPLDRDTPVDRTWEQTGNDIIHPKRNMGSDKKWCHTPLILTSSGATAAVGTHPTRMQSCLKKSLSSPTTRSANEFKGKWVRCFHDATTHSSSVITWLLILPGFYSSPLCALN